MKFTLEEFENISKNKDRLKVFREQLGRIHQELTIKCKVDKKIERTSIPTTFDSMMVDFGRREERKRLWGDLKNEHKAFI